MAKKDEKGKMDDKLGKLLMAALASAAMKGGQAGSVAGDDTAMEATARGVNRPKGTIGRLGKAMMNRGKKY